MSTKPRLLVPYGLKTLLEGLSRAVVSAQPTNISQFASFYFTELLQYRQENPSIDFKELVQEFQRRQENMQIENGPTENTKSDTPYTPVPQAESEKVEPEKEQCPARQDSCASNAPVTEAMSVLLNGALKYPFLHRDISNPLVSAQNVCYQLNLKGKAPEPAVAERKDNGKLLEQTQSRVEVPLKQSAVELERLEKVSSKAQSQPTVANDQVAYPSPGGQNGQYSPGGVTPNGRQTYAATPSISALIPVRAISKPHNLINGPGDVQRIVSNISQAPPDQPNPSTLGSAIHLAQQTVESRMSTACPPAEEISQRKITPGPTENRPRTEAPSSKLYQIHISVDKPVSGVRYEPAYIPGKEASMVHIVTALPTRRTGPTGPASVHYKAVPKLTPENVQIPTIPCRHLTQDPMLYRSVYVPSQNGSRQQWASQMPPCLHLQQPTYRKAESSENYASYVQKTSCSPEAVNKQGFSDARGQLSSSELRQACSSSVQQNLVGSPGENEQAPLFPFYQYGDARQLDLSVDSRYRTEPPPIQRPKHMEFLFCSCMSDPPSTSVQPVLITSPAYVVSDEAKRVESSSPYIVVGSSECQIGHPTMPTPIARTQPNIGNRMPNLSFQRDPMYVSVAVPVEEVQSVRATPSITHLAETRSIPSFAAHGNTIAVEIAATRCPSVMGGLIQKQCLGAKAAQEDGHIKPSKT